MDTRLGIEDVRASLARMTGDEKHDESSTSTLDALWVLYDRVLQRRIRRTRRIPTVIASS